MASGLTRNQMPGNRLRVRIPCPPLRNLKRRLIVHAAFVLPMLAGLCAPASAAEAPRSLELTARSLAPSPKDPKAYLVQLRPLNWNSKETAVIICDMWDSHHCLNAVNRVGELAPRMNELVRAARKQGALIIHAPSECMKAYENHPGRKLAQSAPKADTLPADIGQWCNNIPAEEKGTYPIDQSDGGCDSDPAAQAEFAKKLQAIGRNPGKPWLKETDALTIEPGDAISDSGVEIWNLMEQRGIKNVMLMGVHTNMCVLGRPFGLRQMAKNGKNVVLVRDMTDTMYNPERSPHVSHFTGTDLIVEHIEKFVCPTITSDQLVGGKPFRFPGDKRKHLVMVIADQEYASDRTLPEFARTQLGKDFKVSLVTWPKYDSDELPGIEVLNDADIVLFSVWRRTPPTAQMEVIRKFVASGKPVVGIRIASHAFVKRDGKVAPGHADWPAFCKEVFSANYQGHYHGSATGKDASSVWIDSQAGSNPIVRDVPTGEIAVPSWLYKMIPLNEKATLLMMGRTPDGKAKEPVTWTTASPSGGRVFYTSLGHPDDFALAWFPALLRRGVYWAADLPLQN
jgi:nicotinamidase-related amidase/type 1 glutamine amidotransferase